MPRIRHLRAVPLLTLFFLTVQRPAAAQIAPSNDQAIEALRVEILSAHIAMMNAHTVAVKDLALTIVRNDTKAVEILRGGAPERQKPGTPGNADTNHDAMSTEHQQELEQLSKLSGPEFDQAYLGNFISSHQYVIRILGQEPEAPSTGKETIKRDILPTMRHDLFEAKQIEKGAPESFPPAGAEK